MWHVKQTPLLNGNLGEVPKMPAWQVFSRVLLYMQHQTLARSGISANVIDYKCYRRSSHSLEERSWWRHNKILSSVVGIGPEGEKFSRGATFHETFEQLLGFLDFRHRRHTRWGRSSWRGIETPRMFSAKQSSSALLASSPPLTIRFCQYFLVKRLDLSILCPWSRGLV